MVARPPCYATGESRLRFAIPARIALQGRERASTVAIFAICPLPPSLFWLVRLPRAISLSLPSARKELKPGLVWPAIPVPALEPTRPLLMFPAGGPLHLFPQDTREQAFLRNLLTITRNRGGVNDFAAPRLEFHSQLLNVVHCPRSVHEREVRSTLGAQAVTGVVSDLLHRIRNAGHVNTLDEIGRLGVIHARDH